MMGGYEYTPENENKRAGETIRNKNSEAQLVMPRLFANALWQTKVTDPPNEDAGDVSFKMNPDIDFGRVTHNYYEPYIQSMGQSSKIEGDRHAEAIKKYTRGHHGLHRLPQFICLYRQYAASSSSYTRRAGLYPG